MYDELCGAAVSAAAQATRQALYSLIRLPQYREINTMDVFADAAFPPEVLGEILIRAGAWSPAGNHAVEEMQDGAVPDNAHHIADGDAAVAAAPPAAIAHAARPQICGWSVCRDWRNCLRRGPPPDHLARLLLEVHGPDEALMRALRCTNSAVDRCDLIREVLRLPGVRADCQDGAALFWASARGCEVVVRLMLGWEEHAPRADCQGGCPLTMAIAGGHEQVVRCLQEAINILPAVPVP